MKGLKKYLDILKDLWTPVNAEDIRMAINNALELMGKNVDDNIDRQDELERQFRDVLDETTNKDFNSAPEIRAARDGEANLKARLDKEHQEVTAQLAQTEQALNVERERINNFTKLEEGSTTADAELIDIRVGIDGTVYPTAGDAVRNVLTPFMANEGDEF